MPNSTFHLLLCITFLAGVKAATNFTLPSDIQKCNVSDPNFNTCATVLFNKLVHLGVLGIPSLDIKPLDPFSVSHACFHSSPGSPVGLDLELNNATMYGFANLTIVSTNGTDINKNIIKMRGVIPSMRILSNYSIDGSLIGMSLERFGTLDVLLYNFVINYESYHSPVMKNNQTYLVVRNMTLDTEFHGGNVGYTTDHAVTSLAMNEQDMQNMINQNMAAIYDEYETYVNSLILSVISPSVVRFNNEVPFERMFVK